MEVADTEAVTLVGATSAAVTLPGGTSAEAAPTCTLAAPMCTLAEPASPEAATSGVTAAALLAVGVAGIGVMDPMAATRPRQIIRTATGRNELKPMGVLLNVHLASHESSRLVTSVPSRRWSRDLRRVARPSRAQAEAVLAAAQRLHLDPTAKTGLSSRSTTSRSCRD